MVCRVASCPGPDPVALESCSRVAAVRVPARPTPALAIVLAVVLALGPGRSAAQEVGLGIIVGDPTGPCGKMWLDDGNAVAAAAASGRRTVLWVCLCRVQAPGNYRRAARLTPLAA